MTQQLEDLNRELKASHFKNYSGLSGLQEATKHLSAHMKHNEEFIAQMLAAFHQTSRSLNQLNKTIVHKVEEEHLESWLDRPIAMQGKALAVIGYQMRFSF